MEELLKKHIDEDQRNFLEIREVFFGNKETGEIGLIQKVNELHELLIQAKGVKSFMGIVILIGAVFGAITVIKGFFIR